MDTIFMNSENSKAPDPDRLLLNITEKINSKRSDKYVALSNLSIYYTLKNRKKSVNKMHVNKAENKITFKDRILSRTFNDWNDEIICK